MPPLMSPEPPLEPPPAILADGGQIMTRVMEIKGTLEPHFQRLRLLDRYSRRQKVNWFPKAGVNAPSVMRSTIRAAEKTVIAYLSGGTPSWKVSSYGGYADQAQRDEKSGERDAKFERIARAIFHHIDRQSEVNLLYEPVRRAVREGEIVIQYGWLPEHQRKLGGSFAPLPASEISPENPPDLNLTPDTPEERYRFPLAVRVLSRLRVFYELNSFGEPEEVYHAYTARASQVRQDHPEWEDGRNAHDPVPVIEAWVGGWKAVVIDGNLLEPPRRHHYGERPPFVIERCAPEEVETIEWGETMAEVVVGVPFCLDMLEAFEEACIGSSLKRTILENTAIGAYFLENAHPSRAAKSTTGENQSEIFLGPGTVFQGMKDEKLVPLQPPPLPPALASYLEEAEADMAALSFSPALLRGDAPGDPSGYSVEQIRQAAMARLMPYRDALERSFSRLFERLFALLAMPGHWAPEWGETLTLAGQQGGEFFAEQIGPQDLVPAPQHVEVSLMPAVPQNEIARRQADIADWQAGTADILSIYEERGVADPQEEFDSVLLHRHQLDDPVARAAAIVGILNKRAKRAGMDPRMADLMFPLAPPPMQLGTLPTPPPMPGAGMSQNMPAPGPNNGPGGPRPNADVGGPGAQTPPAARQGSRGPAPQQRPGMRPMGVQGAPNMPIPVQSRKERPKR